MSEVGKAFKELWNGIYHPRCACPDVEIGHVFDVMAKILSKTIKDKELIHHQACKYILSVLYFNSATEYHIKESWSYIAFPTSNRYQMDYDDVDKRVEEEFEYAKRELDKLLEMELVDTIMDGDFVKYKLTEKGRKLFENE